VSSALNIVANRIMCSYYPTMKISASHHTTPVYDRLLVETNVSELFLFYFISFPFHFISFFISFFISLFSFHFILFYCFKGSICVRVDSCIRSTY